MITRINNKKSGKTRTPYSFNFLKDPRTRVVVGLIFYAIFHLPAGVPRRFLFTGGMDQSLIDKETRELMTNPDIVVGNPGRKLGAFLSDLLINRWFGISSFIFCYFLFIIGLRIAGRNIKIWGKNYHQLCPNHLVLLAIGIYFHVLTHRICIPGRGSRLFRVFLA